MVLEDYFDFKDYAEFGEIRIEGHRIWMHNILGLYLDDGLDARQIYEWYPTLTPEKIDACLRYYDANRDAMDKMMIDYREFCEFNRRNPTLILRHTPNGPVLERVNRERIPAGRVPAETLVDVSASESSALHAAGYR